MITEIVEQGTRRLAIPIGVTSRGGSLGRILGLKGSAGWLVSREGAREWRFEGVAQQGDEILLHGPWLPSRPLATILDQPFTEALPALARLVRALARLREAGISPFPIQTDAVLFMTGPGDDGVLFLPPQIMQELRAVRPFEQNRDTFEAVTHPDRQAGESWSFSIAVLLYRLVTGAFPFSGGSPEELHDQARALQVPAPGTLVPEFAPEASQLVMAGLGRNAGPAPTLAQWLEALASWQQRPPFRELSGAERQRILGEAAAAREGSEKRFRRRAFWRRHGKLVAVITVAVALVAAGLGSLLSRALAPRLTRGFGPRLVVEVFYRGMNGMDHQVMQACVVGRAGREEIAESTNLFVISRVTTAYEGRPTVVSAETWDREGRPGLDPMFSLYGVTDLLITEEAGAPSPVFRVDYVKWAPLAPPDEKGNLAGPPSGPRFGGTRRADRAFLRQQDGDWVIFRIDRVAAEPLQPLP